MLERYTELGDSELRAFVTGAAGFIGSNLVDRLLELGHSVTGYDNFSTGYEANLAKAGAHPQFQLVRADLLDTAALEKAMAGHDTVFHLAANADVRFGTEHPRRDLEQNTIVTFNVLEAMRLTGAQRIAFSSTGSIYGEPDVFPTPKTLLSPSRPRFTGLPSSPAKGSFRLTPKDLESKASFSASSRSWGSAIATAMSSISTTSCESIQTSCISWAMATSGSRTCTSRTASRPF